MSNEQPVKMNAKIVKILKAIAENHGQKFKMEKGCLKIARGFYYTCGITPESYSDDIVKIFQKYNITLTIKSKGKVWKPFHGGASFWRQSYFYVNVFCDNIDNAINLEKLK